MSDQLKNLSPAEREFYEERAGILEYEAGLPRDVAEASALKLTLARRDSH